MEEPPASAPKTHSLIYGVEDRMPLGTALLVSFQQVAAMVVGVITPALILSEILKFPAADTAYLVSMALLAAALGTAIQSTRFGLIGSGLLSVTGTSFAFLQPLIRSGQAGGLPLMFGMSLATVPVQFILAPFLPHFRRIFTPLISGVVVVLIGLSIIPEAMRGIVEPVAPNAPPWAGGAIAAVVIGAVLFAQAFGRPRTRMASILVGVFVGYIVCGSLGYLHAPPPSQSWLTVPRILPHQLAYRADFFIPFASIYVVSILESMGDITATSQLSGLDTKTPEHWLRIRGGVLGDAFTSAIAAIVGSFPSTTYAQNNGVIQITGVASRHIGKIMAVILAVLGLFPGVARWVTAMPPPVLGGMALLLFGLVAVAGLRLIIGAGLDHRNSLIVAVSLGVGLGAPTQPQWLEHMPSLLRTLLESGVSAGGIVALLLNLALPGGHAPAKAEA